MLCSSTPSIDGKVALEKIRSNTYDSINMDINNYNFQFNPKTSEWTTNVNAYNEEIKDKEEEIEKEISVLVKEEERIDMEYDKLLKEYQFKMTQILILTKVVSKKYFIYELYIHHIINYIYISNAKPKLKYRICLMN